MTWATRRFLPVRKRLLPPGLLLPLELSDIVLIEEFFAVVVPKCLHMGIRGGESRPSGQIVGLLLEPPIEMRRGVGVVTLFRVETALGLFLHEKTNRALER